MDSRFQNSIFPLYFVFTKKLDLVLPEVYIVLYNLAVVTHTLGLGPSGG